MTYIGGCYIAEFVKLLKYRICIKIHKKRRIGDVLAGCYVHIEYK